LSLLGRLEDLSLPDIIQIVFLSRRTGVLEIVDADGRSTILFHHGLIIDATSPNEPDLGEVLRERASGGSRVEIDRMIEEGAPLGTALIELGMMRQEELASLVRERITRIVTPLLESRDGEFNFILSDAAGQFELEYDPDSLFREGGISPQIVLGGGEGEKLKPLSGLEETMRAGKALLGAHRRAPGAMAPAPPPRRSEIPLHPAANRSESEALDQLDGAPAPSRPPAAGGDVFETPIAEDPRQGFDLAQFEAEESTPPAAASPRRREVDVPAGDPFDTFFAPSEMEEPDFADALLGPATEESPAPAGQAPLPEETMPDDAYLPAPPTATAIEVETLAETVLLYEPDPLLRVAARRAFTKKGFEFLQFGNLADTREAAMDLLGKDRFFVTFLDLVGTGAGSDSPDLMLETIKSKDRALPVVLIDREADMKRRHELLELGADFYLTKPSPAHLQPGFAEETLGLFAEELMMFAERAFGPRRPRSGSSAHAAAREMAELSSRERTERAFALLRRLISELTDPDDLGQLSATILRMAESYLERGVLFSVDPDSIAPLGGFGETGSGEEMAQRVRRITIPRSEPSVLGEVIQSTQPHRGKLRRSRANEGLIRALGDILPTEVAVLPITHRGAVVGLLYGDNARTRRALPDLSGLEIFLSQAGLALENALSAHARSHGRS
jgi:CheY-like chemotaxis protein